MDFTTTSAAATGSPAFPACKAADSWPSAVAGVGVRRVLMQHANTPRAHDLFDTILTALDPDVVLDVVSVGAEASANGSSGSLPNFLMQDVDQAEKIGRQVAVHKIEECPLGRRSCGWPSSATTT